MDDFLTQSWYDIFVGGAVLVGICLQHLLMFGKTIESYNWGLLGISIALEVAWIANRLLSMLTPVRDMYVSLRAFGVVAACDRARACVVLRYMLELPLLSIADACGTFICECDSWHSSHQQC